jgi:hypothetical protein
MTDVAKIAAGLTKAQREALLALPALRDADRMHWKGAVTYSNSWRKQAKHTRALRSLHWVPGLVESKVSRGETLWRLRKPLGHAVRNHLQENPDAD